jgi:hypothetical protein
LFHPVAVAVGDHDAAVVQQPMLTQNGGVGSADGIDEMGQ